MADSIYERLNHLNVKFNLVQLTTEKVLGSDKITQTVIGQFFGNFATYGGTEREANGKYVIEDTAVITTFYRPDIASDCKLIRVLDNAPFEIINEPENYKMENRALIFKVKRLKGKF